ncbi:Protein of unknown function DUF3368 [Moorella glycerini]|uniref:DUF3368 domain-containing protein n=1 Tax=Neomoorella stamsii TaxID=1266720 RepID=A0A9X7J5A8_9FIRM|nr:MULTISPECIES: DUF3368 domain-containing protein [Moorella]PRR76323.1 hypothetical protein MOST_04840 [Moorella stamsii]CEP67109.1 Protein of unknown function DUF3368 [Moorella glycerini]
MKVIADTSMLIALSHLRQLDLVKKLWSKVFIPETVYEEVLQGGSGATGVQEVENAVKAGWLIVHKVQSNREVAFLTTVLGPGEAEVLVLGNELNADLLLIDEKKARRIAIQAGFEVLGVLGVINLAVSKNLIDRKEVPAIVDTLKNKGFRLGEGLVERFLKSLEIQ